VMITMTSVDHFRRCVVVVQLLFTLLVLAPAHD